MKITEATRKALEKHPLYLDSLREGIVNHTELARRIYPEVCKKLGEKPLLDSVKMALIRIGRKLREDAEEIEKRIEEVISKSTLELKEDVAVVTVRMRALDDLLRAIKHVRLRFVQITQGIETFTIAFDRRDYEEVKRLLREEDVISESPDQSAIILISPEEIVQTPGVISYVTSALSRNHVNITQIISCYTDTIFVVERNESLKAYGILKELIESFRKYP